MYVLTQKINNLMLLIDQDYELQSAYLYYVYIVLSLDECQKPNNYTVMFLVDIFEVYRINIGGKIKTKFLEFFSKSYLIKQLLVVFHNLHFFKNINRKVNVEFK